MQQDLGEPYLAGTGLSADCKVDDSEKVELQVKPNDKRGKEMKVISKCAFGALLLAGLVATVGCRGSSSGGLLTKSPSDVVSSAYMAANAGQYSEAEKYLSSEVLNAMKGSLGAMAGGMKAAWDETTRDGTIDKVEILNEEVRGEGAKVYFRIHF
ncbi:MAG: hypothetical protein ACJ8CN_15530, partial [Gemmatimonadales bacterium]